MEQTTMIGCVVGAILIIMIAVFMMHKKEGYGEKKNIPTINITVKPDIVKYLSMDAGLMFVNTIQQTMGESRFFLSVKPTLQFKAAPEDNFQVQASMPGKTTVIHSFFFDFSQVRSEEEKHVIVKKHIHAVVKQITKCKN
jgi:hypothetical protein